MTGVTTIPGWQRKIHVLTEAASVLMVPFVFAAAKATNRPHKQFLYFLGGSMLVVDGLLLVRWFSTPVDKQWRVPVSDQFSTSGDRMGKDDRA